MNKLVIVGCGGFGREVAEVVTAVNNESTVFDLLGCADDSPSTEDLEGLKRLGLRALGNVTEVLASPVTYSVIGIGNRSIRELLDNTFQQVGRTASVLLHPDTSIGADVTLRPGSILCAGVRLTTNVYLGRHVHVNLDSTIGNDSTVLNYSTVNSPVAVSGDDTAGERSTLGTHSAVPQNLTIGADSTVGGSARVVKDLAANVTVKGIPAR